MKPNETREKVFEKELSAYVARQGGFPVKLLSQFTNGLPDRMYLLPDGYTLFVEFKTTGKKPTAIQSLQHDRLRKLGFHVLVVDSVESYNKAREIIEGRLLVNCC